MGQWIAVARPADRGPDDQRSEAGNETALTVETARVSSTAGSCCSGSRRCGDARVVRQHRGNVRDLRNRASSTMPKAPGIGPSPDHSPAASQERWRRVRVQRHRPCGQLDTVLSRGTRHSSTRAGFLTTMRTSSRPSWPDSIRTESARSSQTSVPDSHSGSAFSQVRRHFSALSTDGKSREPAPACRPAHPRSIAGHPLLAGGDDRPAGHLPTATPQFRLDSSMSFDTLRWTVLSSTRSISVAETYASRANRPLRSTLR